MSRKKVLVFGAGWLGTKFSHYLQADLVKADITDPHRVTVMLDAYKPDTVLCAAGKTGRPNIDWCEATPENKWQTFRSNTLGPYVLGRACDRRGIPMVLLSSGCIFNGPSPGPDGWTEDDVPNPVSLYGVTRAQGDKAAMMFKSSLVVRLRMPVDDTPDPRNLITKLAGYRQVIDVINSVTVIPGLLEAVRALIDRGANGIYNVTNPGAVRHAEILEWYRRRVDPSHRYELVAPERISELAVAGRSNCILDTSKLRATGIVLPDARDAIRDCLRKYAQAMKK